MNEKHEFFVISNFVNLLVKTVLSTLRTASIRAYVDNTCNNYFKRNIINNYGNTYTNSRLKNIFFFSSEMVDFQKNHHHRNGNTFGDIKNTNSYEYTKLKDLI